MKLPPGSLPKNALEAYEELRTAAVGGRPRPEGLALLRFHGLLQGLPLLVEKETSARTSDSHREPLVGRPRPDDAFVRLLANLVLSTHAEELTHAY
ncbi:hypothetical protein [Acidithiobacillus ferriphilus]|uniref:hypothetical protein n=1 Tax=Acidithiobacillus ferriphilus TaxID=1689834 RepID=UPI00242CC726|nr:hypothetical protein [Acidithiobacillus ferriphilus]MBW9254155.1 hypothetical protein [Acidithiobacillus ferriphilus]